MSQFLDDFLFEMGDLLAFTLSAVFAFLILAALVNAAKTNQWVWFVLTLFLWPIAIAYLVFGYRSPARIRAVRDRERRLALKRDGAHQREITDLRGELEALKRAGLDPSESTRS